MTGHDYVKQKLHQAVLALVGDGEIDKRLASVAGYVVHMPDRNVPEKFREEFAAIKTALLSIPIPSTNNDVPGPASTELTREIVVLHSDVMGGL